VYNVRIIGPMADATGSHLSKRHHVLMRMPIKNTTNGAFVLAL